MCLQQPSDIRTFLEKKKSKAVDNRACGLLVWTFCVSSTHLSPADEKHSFFFFLTTTYFLKYNFTYWLCQ